MKTFAKSLIVLGLAIFLGRLLVSYTSRGAERYQDMKRDARLGVLHFLDAQPKNFSGSSFSGSQTTGEIATGDFDQGVVIGTDKKQVSTSVLRQRMNYYKEHKNDLWSGKDLPL